ncbi:MAG TPA: hypothetical protein VHI54_12280 [Actinomycetota bacterium]|nr:hypothetical protein [Actinomycetota bacterium]
MIGSSRHVPRPQGDSTSRPEGGALDGHGPPDPAVVLAAVRTDVQETLRMAWIDPALDAATASAAFFTAAWSAIRPNVGKSFLNLCRQLRVEAVDVVRSAVDSPPDLRKKLEEQFSDGELRQIEEAATAAYLGTAKTQVVVHALHRAIRGDRIPGTGGEEPPVRRGVPDWQKWLAGQPTPDPALATLEDATAFLGLSSTPSALRLMARWPTVLSSAWAELKPATRLDSWKTGTGKLRRLVLAGVSTLPHPIDLQWTALKARGFREEDRVALADRLATYDVEMPVHTLVASFLWVAFGSPEVGSES